MKPFNHKATVAALFGALALLSGCGNGQSTSVGTQTGSFNFNGGSFNGGGSAVGCVPLNQTSATSIGVSASGYLSPLVTGTGISYGIDYTQVMMSQIPQNFSYRFSSAMYGDGLYLRFPDSAATQANSARIPVSGDIGVVVIGPDTTAAIMSMFGGGMYGYGNSGVCVAGISRIWAYGTQGADIVGPKVMLTLQGPGGSRQPFEMYGF